MLFSRIWCKPTLMLVLIRLSQSELPCNSKKLKDLYGHVKTTGTRKSFSNSSFKSNVFSFNDNWTCGSRVSNNAGCRRKSYHGINRQNFTAVKCSKRQLKWIQNRALRLKEREIVYDQHRSESNLTLFNIQLTMNILLKVKR